MIIARILAGIPAFTLLLSAGCGRNATRTSVVGTPVEGAERALAIDAVQHLRGDVNAGACQRIYEDAAPYFRSQAPEDWKKQCVDLRETLGSWLSSDISGADRGTPQEVMLQGSGVFGKSSKSLYVGWHLQRKHAELLWIIVLLDPNNWMHMPPQPHSLPPGPLYIDPPMF
jgi:hypothetical protein